MYIEELPKKVKNHQQPKSKVLASEFNEKIMKEKKEAQEEYVEK